ncbi:MAG: PEGA domain-containing protein [Armatimonadetes bacterium]|nr:PEGA domain-containing protein [Armatimonadota bacterium]
MPRFALVFAAALCALLCHSCGGSDGCTADVVPGIVLRVVDAETGITLVRDSVVTLQSGDYTETLRTYESIYSETRLTPPNTPVSVAGAYERVGDYTIRVERDGYEPWEQTTRVTRNECHVNRNDLTASLKRVAP